LGNIANMVVCGLSMSIVATLIIITTRRRAAVGAFFLFSIFWQPPERSACPLTGRSEFRIFLIMYFISLPFQLLTTGAVLQQGSTALVALTALHAGVVAALFWALLGNAIVSTQVVEDGTLSSLVVRPPLALHSPSTRRVAHCPRIVANVMLPRSDSHCVSSPLLSLELQPISLWTWPYR